MGDGCLDTQSEQKEKWERWTETVEAEACVHHQMS